MKTKIVKRKSTRSALITKSTEEKTTVSISAKDFVLSQSTIIASVACEEESFLIHPSTSKFVNSNGDAWSNEACKANYKSFIGAYNYVNHHQDPNHAVGFIADVALRRIPIKASENLHNYYADILIATHRDFSSLVSKLLSNKIQYMSMGCESLSSQCSRCGEVHTEETDTCKCLSKYKGKSYIDKKGKRRVVAELLGNEEAGSCNFIEASWLTEVPAFKGAAKRHHLAIDSDKNIEVEIPTAFISKDAIQRFLN